MCSIWTRERKSGGVDLPSVVISFFAIASGFFRVTYWNVSNVIDKKNAEVCRDLTKEYMKIGK